ncbi:MAG: penicillin-binding transpeptidase domain-containing protein [Candidatus Auribacterota bacterium]|jgi:cell division protein FtsI (penicillin-binding protein 3)|nr:penicillin-binding transpeptidase domain-containing protein [Candidatus Auribacterota bacterium]
MKGCNTKNYCTLRIYLVTAFLGVCFVIVIARLYYLQTLKQENFIELANYQHIAKTKIHPKRGEIRDRSGKALAVNVEVESVFADPRYVEDPHLCAYHLTRILGVEEKDTFEKLTRKKSFVWIKRKIDLDVAEQIKALNLSGIGFRKEVKRVYPNGRLLSHVLGFTGIDGEGLEGMEMSMDGVLSGETGWRIVSKDARRREVWHCMPLEKPAVNGHNIELTIDSMIQYIAESELEAAYNERKPIWAGIIVMRPKTGEILAMATRPTYDPNNFQYSETDERRNRVITDIFEPGSIFKPLSCAAALNEGVVRFDDVFYCERGAYRVARHTLHDSHPYEYLSFPEIIAVSSNIGTAKISMNLGGEKLYRYLSDFGLGQVSDIPLLGEAKGIFHHIDRWSKLSIVCVPMGQEVSVSALQMLKGFSALANNGLLMKPYLIKRIIDEHGNVVQSFEPEPIKQVVTPKTAKMINEALKMAVRKGGTGIHADIPEYTVAGKTGTAQKAENGRYSHTKFVGSFVGYVPADDPELSIIVVMDQPKGQYYGGVVSAPVFREVARKVLKYLEILPEPERIPLTQINNKMGG